MQDYTPSDAMASRPQQICFHQYHARCSDDFGTNRRAAKVDTLTSIQMSQFDRQAEPRLSSRDDSVRAKGRAAF